MIYPEVDAATWCKKYPLLKVLESICDGCSSRTKTTKAFLSKDYVGLQAPPCPCGKGRHTSMFIIPIGKKEIEAWDNALNGFLDNP